MTTTRFGVLPTFTEGQVLSATAHLNALQQVTQGLADDFIGIEVPFNGNSYVYGGDGQFVVFQRWYGALRHKVNYLSWIYTQHESGTTYITIGGITVPGSVNTGTGTQVDISSMGLTVDQFYEVQIVTDVPCSLKYLCEVRPNVTPSALIDFNDEVTPTAVQWQALSDYASELIARSSAPCALMRRTHDGNSNAGTGLVNCKHLHTLVNHRGRYLAYNFWLSVPPPWSENDPGGDRYVQAEILINDNVVYKARSGAPDGPVTDGPPIKQETWFDSKNWFGVLDLDAFAPELVIGTNYDLKVQIFMPPRPGDMFGCGGIFYIFEYADVGEVPSGWLALDEWEHADWVYGDSNAPQVQAIKTNLAALESVLRYRNYPTVRIMSQEDRFGLAGVRQRRFLHYRIRFEHNTTLPPAPDWDTDPDWNYNDDMGYPEKFAKAGRLRFYPFGQQPDPTYPPAGKEQTVSLTNPFETWGVLDMDSVDGLEVGVQYYLDDVRYAIEDDTP